MNLVIRSTVRADMREVIELLQEVSGFRPNPEDYEVIWETFSAQPNLKTVVALAGNKIVGYGALSLEVKIRGGKMGHIEDIVSHREFRKRGVGSAIIDALLNLARDEGCYKIALQCKSSNVPFYEKCGYTVSGNSLQQFL
jgi:glucosamine-phosphate N-acetyltransferase